MTIKADAIEHLLDFARVQSAHVRAMRLAVIANALDAACVGSDRWTFYARDRGHYAQLRRCSPPGYTRRAVVAAVEELAAEGCLEHERTRPSPSAEFRSRFRATPALMERLAHIRAGDFVFGLPECIILRDDEGAEVPYRESRRIRAMRRDVQAHNMLLAEHTITVRHQEVESDGRGFLIVRGRRLNPGRTQYRRIFNARFCLGGRWHGPWWQGLPSFVRSGVEIDGDPTVELDFRACHLRLLSASAGVTLPFEDPGFDPFAIAGVERRHAKVAFNIALNASGEASALRALVQELGPGSCPYSAGDLIASIRNRFPDLGSYWNTGVGLRLQCIDADICARIQRVLRSAGIPCLSAHDSFIVPERARSELETAMRTEFDRACDRLRRQPLPQGRRAAH